ncbi:MAG TPA: 2-C-methyl-D-erythritol 4-phosphate cytidylyltransferase, partial [Pseudolysinimonas sp.]|nr:2-C-methyl-D-erythritol 4-phosphate cytidylyltransferase [Pseudolysinimonas sp.]
MAAHSQSTVAAILVAAGSGERLGAAVPKAFVQVAGAALLEHAMRRFAAHPRIDIVVVVAPGSHLD